MNAERPMTPEELVAHGYPADLHTRPGAYLEFKAAEQRVGYGEPVPIVYPTPVPASSHVAVKEEKRQPRFTYTREQKGHSLILNLLIIGPITLWITTIYYTVSPRHFWHA